MTENMGKWPSKRGPITKIMPSDGCKGDIIPLAVGKWYHFHEFGCRLGNVGKVRNNIFSASRRSLLLLCASGLSTAALPGCLKASAWLSRSERPAAVEGLFYQLFADLSAARMLGRRYLADHSDEHSREWLIKKVLKGARPRNLETLRAVLANNLRRDFSEGYIVIVDGWVLSRTEARAAAIVFCSQTG